MVAFILELFRRHSEPPRHDAWDAFASSIPAAYRVMGAPNIETLGQSPRFWG